MNAHVSIDTAAERVRSVLVSAQSLTLHSPSHRAELVGRHQVLDDGRMAVELPTDHCMTRQLISDGQQLAMIEVTDLVPVPVRDRIRCRVTLTGSLAPVGVGTDDGELFALFHPSSAELVRDGQTLTVEPTVLADARPDPFATSEAKLLCYLSDHRRDVIELLVQLLPPEQRLGMRTAQPVQLDRLGIVVRLELPGGDHDIRLDFPTPADNLDELNACLDALLARARNGRQPSP
ncbi:hypothetical protein AV521_40445 [Streptomyces sp. IMTB 2501]|uniref:DUF2470 domain-containing protein n=1 Tax=Streptomyces sp. IMTB 2501 TaxID=1776340 RepID=UPI00096C422D|nr:DUF2470 domain-containing protein [Streptomyces sp. IMTB 2501]OLZ62883.1 hypothetical protein AV521_40445 [Streptomyces sp. IMTB 2501]